MTCASMPTPKSIKAIRLMPHEYRAKGSQLLVVPESTTNAILKPTARLTMPTTMRQILPVADMEPS